MQFRRQTWMDKSACKGASIDIFVPELADNRNIKAAKQFCQYCPVRPQCFAYALANPELVGIWGGTTYRQRQELRKRKRILTRTITRL